MDREPTDVGPERDRRDQPAGAAASPFPAAPRMLSRRAAPAPMPAPLQEADEIATLHARFLALVSAAQGEATEAARPGATGGGQGGIRAKVRARVAAVARADAGADREFMGHLVRAVAALAERMDDVTARVGDLELLVQDVCDRLSEDLVRVQAAMGALGDQVERPSPGE